MTEYRTISHLKKYLDESLLDLGPEMYIPPTIAADGPYGLKRISLFPPIVPDSERQRRQDIPAFLLVSDAEDAAVMMFSVRQVLDPLADPDTSAETSENITIFHWYPGGESVFSAPLLRRNGQPPVVGEWRLVGDFIGVSGSVNDGIRNGLSMLVRLKLPEHAGLRERIDSIRKRFADQDVLPVTVTALVEEGWLE